MGLFRGLDPERFRTYLICPPPLLEAFGEAEPNERVLGLDLQNPWQFPQNREFMRFLRKERIDILNAHMTRAAMATVPLARWARVPVVVQTSHGREGWRQSRGPMQYWVDRRLAAMTDITIAVSEATKRYLVTEKKLTPEKIVVIPNGRNMNGAPLDPSAAQKLRDELGIGQDHAVLGVFGRLEPQKGHRFFLQAMPAIAAHAGPATALLVGDGSLRPALEEQTRALGLTGRIIFTGHRHDALQIMAACDLIVLPSLYEGMPLVPIEAASLGKAVVATAVDGTREVIEDGVTGLLVPHSSPSQTAEAVTRLILNPDLRRTLGENARKRAQEHFSQERHLRETAACYELLHGPALSDTVSKQ